MPYDYETNRQKRAARGEALQTICDTLADELTRESGDTWTRGERDEAPGAFSPEDRFRGYSFTRGRDGFTLRLFAVLYYNESDKIQGRISWPRNPNPENAAGAVMRDAPGFYDHAEPGVTFTATKTTARTVAKRMLRELVTEDTQAAWAALVQRWADETDNRNDAETWRRRVSEAAGIECRPDGNGDPYFSTWKTWADKLTTDKHRPGGKLTIDLPDEFDDAAKLVAGVRALVEAQRESGR